MRNERRRPASGNRPDIARVLLAKGATEDVFTALRLGHRKRMAALLDADPALLGTRDERGATLLHTAARLGQYGAVESLLARGLDVNAKDDYGETPLAKISDLFFSSDCRMCHKCHISLWGFIRQENRQ